MTEKTILVVDDDEEVREGLRGVLLLEGYRVVVAGNGLEAVAMLDSQHCDLVLVDMNMPHQNGWGTIASIRFRLPRLPAIIITARPDQRTLARETGVELMEKPLDVGVLVGRVRELLGETCGVARGGDRSTS